MQTGMKFVVVESAELGKQTFGFPSNLDSAAVAKVADYIRHGDSRNWRRVKCTFVESGEVGFGTDALKNMFSDGEMKYIVTDSDEGGKQLFIFPKKVDHDRMSDVLHEIEESIDGAAPDNFYRKPVSAGFTNGKDCYGRSETLGLKSNASDSVLLAAMLRQASAEKLAH